MSSPYINRFLQPDSLIPDQTNPQAWNRYGYVVNNPVNLTDPTGHKWDDCEGLSGYRCKIHMKHAAPAIAEGNRRAEAIRLAQALAAMGRGGRGYPSVIGGRSQPQYSPTGTVGGGRDEVEDPDYYSLNGCYFVICGQVVRDYYNNWYWGVGPGLSSGLSVSLNAGWLLETGRSEDAIQNFTLESSVFVGGVFPIAGPLGIGPAGTWGDPSLIRPFDYHDLAGEIQAGNAGGAGGYLYDFWIYDSGDPTPWFWQDRDGINNLNP